MKYSVIIRVRSNRIFTDCVITIDIGGYKNDVSAIGISANLHISTPPQISHKLQIISSKIASTTIIACSWYSYMYICKYIRMYMCTCLY